MTNRQTVIIPDGVVYPDGYVVTYDLATDSFFPKPPVTSYGPTGLGYAGLTSSTTFNASTVSGVTIVTTNLPNTATAFDVGMRVRFSSAATPTDYAEGIISSPFAGYGLIVSFDTNAGANTTHSDWKISVTGNVGSTGPTGPTGTTGPTGPTGPALTGTAAQVLQYNNSAVLTAQSMLYASSTTITAAPTLGFIRGAGSDVIIGAKIGANNFNALSLDSGTSTMWLGATGASGPPALKMGSPTSVVLQAATNTGVTVDASNVTIAGFDAATGGTVTASAGASTGMATTKSSIAVVPGNSGTSTNTDGQVIITGARIHSPSVQQRPMPGDSNTLFWWKLDELAAGGAVPASWASSGTNATTMTKIGSGTVAVGQGIHGNALSFTAANNTIVWSGNYSSVVSTATLSFWVNPTVFIANTYFVSKDYWSEGTYTKQGFYVGFSATSSDNWKVFVIDNAAGTHTYSSANFAVRNLPIGVWSHISVTVDSVAISIYLNGKLIYRTTTGYTPSFGAGGWHIGGLLWGDLTVLGGSTFTGYIDDVRVDTIVRSSKYISDLYNSAFGTAQIYDGTYATDASTYIRWKFDETGTPWKHSGTLGSAVDLTVGEGSVDVAPGILGNAVRTSLGPLISADNSFSPASPVTISAWVNLSSYTIINSNNTQGIVISKNYRTISPTPWSTPYTSLYIGLAPSADGSWVVQVTTGSAVINTFTVGGANVIPLNTWCLLSFTYDGSTIKAYLNGNLAGSMSATGSIDYGTNGPWMVGGRLASWGAPGQYFDGMIDDVRIESVARSEAYFKAMYQKGFVGITYVDVQGRLVYQSPNGNIKVLGEG